MIKNCESAGKNLDEIIVNTAVDYQSVEFQRIRQNANQKISNRLFANKDIQMVLRMLADTWEREVEKAFSSYKYVEPSFCLC